VCFQFSHIQETFVATKQELDGPDTIIQVPRHSPTALIAKMATQNARLRIAKANSFQFCQLRLKEDAEDSEDSTAGQLRAANKRRLKEVAEERLTQEELDDAEEAANDCAGNPKCDEHEFGPCKDDDNPSEGQGDMTDDKYGPYVGQDGEWEPLGTWDPPADADGDADTSYDPFGLPTYDSPYD
jgi:hypothetical protein